MIGDAKVKIVNDALGWLGNEPVVDLSAASLAASVGAVKILRVIERAREVVLARHGWTCALEYVTLSPVKIAGYNAPPAYPSTFLLPPDAVRVWSVDGQITTSTAWQGWEPRWQVGTTEVDGAPRMILRGAQPVFDGLEGTGYQFGGGWSSAPSSSDAGASGAAQTGLAGVAIAYVRLADWASLDAQVADAVAMQAAWRAAISITADAGVAAHGKNAAEKAIMDAIGGEANQEGGQPALAASIPAAIRNMAR